MRPDGGWGVKRKGHISKLNGDRHAKSHLRWQDQEVTLHMSWGPFISLHIFISKSYFLPNRKACNTLSSCVFFSEIIHWGWTAIFMAGKLPWIYRARNITVGSEIIYTLQRNKILIYNKRLVSYFIDPNGWCHRNNVISMVYQ